MSPATSTILVGGRRRVSRDSHGGEATTPAVSPPTPRDLCRFPILLPVSLSLLLSPPLRPFLIPFLLGLLLDLIFVGIVKLTFRRARPAYNHPSMSAAVSADHQGRI
ncbi:unnamed protein product [Microthlaspi erraticum]|uniref:Uncharacterized protein n=1 Tax=Microthlaspi erraticum TaxID=1685480 RepID=A0A6D2L6D8_9BRAS|nr:unnamed protein product [Microthlaspi erraticum]